MLVKRSLALAFLFVASLVASAGTVYAASHMMWGKLSSASSPMAVSACENNSQDNGDVFFVSCGGIY